MNRTSATAIKEHYEETRPGISSYLDCLTRSYGTGVGALAFTFAVVHVTQQIVIKRFPAVRRTHLAVSAVAGVVASYIAAKDKVRKCRDSWAASREQ
ncbi:uncharacterized protein LOC112601136 [Melanaphis sacchari]|uniref:uncharacterized protein LOC112601136 n=1 Tax=Melanaphis sacchari TaxID=742174 RepID=UPI000DC13154|nr:uncharacterized protein LOC112601136 [Melanaphis sacchari]